MIVSPSLLAIDFLKLETQLAELNQSGAQWFHYDVMDGHFVRNLTFGPMILNTISDKSPLKKDVHLMVDDPLKFCGYFLACQPDYLTIHYEALADVGEFVAFCHNNGIKPGISIKPNTPVTVLDDIADLFDLVLVMSVEPGFGNQKFIESALDKISYLANRPHQYLIEVDGGINAETAILCKSAGVDVLVAGSYIFKGDIRDRVQSLL